MKKFIELIRTKERDERPVPSSKKMVTKEEKPAIQVQAPSHDVEQQPNDLFWDDYSDVGYC